VQLPFWVHRSNELGSYEAEGNVPSDVESMDEAPGVA
jgi:hypothetical protein